ncbi:cytochrome P450 6A1-like protein [Leptotrombidium deliense]|uniref:Cytochrome P450 6A1-like protein n=1 Tax=Leptotrombidium deliense TaxID=299467 RepID=A0A443S9M8_9ACAR|nr:cytochrome P450 6A1-like protein [Leptotrombidium deliense]
MNIYVILLCILLAVFLKKYSSFPGPKINIPFIGSLEVILNGLKIYFSPNFMSLMYEYVKTLNSKYGKSGKFCIFAGNRTIVILTKAPLIKKYFEKYGSFTTQDTAIQKGENVFPKIMLVLGPDKWKLRRKYLSVAYTSTNLKVFETIINRETKFMLHTIAEEYVDNGFIDIRKLITTHVCLTTLDVMTQVYDRNYLYNEIENVLKFIETAQKGSVRRVTNPLLWLPYLTMFTIDGMKLIYEEYLFSKKFAKFIHELQNLKSNKASMLDQLLKLKTVDKSLKDKTIFRELFGFLTAGFETSAFTIIASLFYMGKHLYSNFV